MSPQVVAAREFTSNYVRSFRPKTLWALLVALSLLFATIAWFMAGASTALVR